jgi:hypothetical protein
VFALKFIAAFSIEIIEKPDIKHTLTTNEVQIFKQAGALTQKNKPTGWDGGLIYLDHDYKRQPGHTLIDAAMPTCCWLLHSS